MDHGYAHMLYSGSIPQALITRADGSIETIEGWGALATPFPNERRTLRQRFEAVADNGDRLHIRDPRPALADLHYIKRDQEIQKIGRAEFLSAAPTDPLAIVGIELESRRHRFYLELAGARMLKREKQGMIYAIEFKPDFFQADQLEHLRFLPNIEELQLSKTEINDKDLELLLALPKLRAVGLSQTAITDRGVEILSKSKSLKFIEAEGSQISDATLLEFRNSRSR